MHALRIAPDQTLRLRDMETGAPHQLEKKEAETRLEKLGERIARLQPLLYGAGTHSMLVILQGMDASGKDGTIRRVFDFLNPLGCRAVAFRAPSEEEAAHDFLWRIHAHAPARGQVVIFNRSHYEDVLVPVVRGTLDRERVRNRCEQINQFEALLASSGTLVLKFFLHLSKDEQEKRLLERESDETKAWKLAVGDWKDRQLWNDYQAAYETLLGRCSREGAPWHVVPADKKWFRNLAVAEVVAATLDAHESTWRETLRLRSKTQAAAIEAFRATQTS